MYIKDNDAINENFLNNMIMAVQLYKSVKELHDSFTELKTDFESNPNLKMGIMEKISNTNSKVLIDENYIIIKNIKFNKFVARIREYYSENNFSKIFMMEYTKFSENNMRRNRLQKNR